MAGVILLIAAAWCVLGGVVGLNIGTGKGRGAEGFWLGFVLGVIGWIIVAVMEPSEAIRAQRNQQLAVALNPEISQPTRECPWCAETIKKATKVCRFCGHDLEPIAEPEPVWVAPTGSDLRFDGRIDLHRFPGYRPRADVEPGVEFRAHGYHHVFLVKDEQVTVVKPGRERTQGEFSVSDVKHAQIVNRSNQGGVFVVSTRFSLKYVTGFDTAHADAFDRLISLLGLRSVSSP